MADAKPIVRIQVDAEAFEKFKKEFESYKTLLDEMPESWKKLNGAMNDLASHFGESAKEAGKAVRDTADATDVLGSNLDRATKKQKGLTAEFRRGVHALNAMVQKTEKFSKSILQAGKNILKLGAVGAGLTFGGLFGIDAFANRAMNLQRSARGLGMTVGQKSAWETYMSPFVDAEGILSRSANAQMDVTKQAPLRAMGLSTQQIRHSTPAELSSLIINKARSLLSGWAPEMRLPMAHAYGIDQFLSADDMRRIVKTSRSTLERAEFRGTHGTEAFGFSDRVAKEWRDLSVVFRKARLQIESTLIQGLAPLAPKFTQMSEDFTKWFVAFAKSGKAQKLVSDFADDLSKTMKYLGSEDFKKSARTFGEALSILASAVVGTAGIIGKATGATVDFASKEWLGWHNMFGSFDTVKSKPMDEQEAIKAGILPKKIPLELPLEEWLGWHNLLGSFDSTKAKPMSAPEAVKAGILPKSTQAYTPPSPSQEVRAFLRNAQQVRLQKSATVRIDNRTSARVSDQANAVSH